MAHLTAATPDLAATSGATASQHCGLQCTPAEPGHQEEVHRLVSLCQHATVTVTGTNPENLQNPFPVHESVHCNSPVSTSENIPDQKPVILSQETCGHTAALSSPVQPSPRSLTALSDLLTASMLQSSPLRQTNSLAPPPSPMSRASPASTPNPGLIEQPSTTRSNSATSEPAPDSWRACRLCPSAGPAPGQDPLHAETTHRGTSFSCAPCREDGRPAGFFVTLAEVKDHVSASYGASGNFLFSIHLPSEQSSLVALACRVCTAPSSPPAQLFLSKEQLGLHLKANHGNFYFKRLERSSSWWCRVCETHVEGEERAECPGCLELLQDFAILEQEVVDREMKVLQREREKDVLKREEEVLQRKNVVIEKEGKNDMPEDMVTDRLHQEVMESLGKAHILSQDRIQDQELAEDQELAKGSQRSRKEKRKKTKKKKSRRERSCSVSSTIISSSSSIKEKRKKRSKGTKNKKRVLENPGEDRDSSLSEMLVNSKSIAGAFTIKSTNKISFKLKPHTKPGNLLAPLPSMRLTHPAKGEPPAWTQSVVPSLHPLEAMAKKEMIRSGKKETMSLQEIGSKTSQNKISKSRNTQNKGSKSKSKSPLNKKYKDITCKQKNYKIRNRSSSIEIKRQNSQRYEINDSRSPPSKRSRSRSSHGKRSTSPCDKKSRSPKNLISRSSGHRAKRKSRSRSHSSRRRSRSESKVRYYEKSGQRAYNQRHNTKVWKFKSYRKRSKSPDPTICSFCHSRPSCTMQEHYASTHPDLCYSCSLCPLLLPRLREAEDHLRECHGAEGRVVGLLVLPGTASLRRGGGVAWGAWAAVRCKGRCTFTGIGLQVR